MAILNFRSLAFLAVVAISAGCADSNDADDIELGESADEVQGADDVEPGEDDGVGEFTITMSGDMTGQLTGTAVRCAEFRDTRMVTLSGEYEGETLDVALSNETFADGTFGKVIAGRYLRSAGQGGTLTMDANGATFENLEVGAVTITGKATC